MTFGTGAGMIKKADVKKFTQNFILFNDFSV